MHSMVLDVFLGTVGAVFAIEARLFLHDAVMTNSVTWREECSSSPSLYHAGQLHNQRGIGEKQTEKGKTSTAAENTVLISYKQWICKQIFI